MSEDANRRDGFRSQARRLVGSLAKMLIADIQHSGLMREDYDADTGEGLAPPASSLHQSNEVGRNGGREDSGDC